MPRAAPRPAVDREESPLGARMMRALEHANLSQTALERRLVAEGIITKGYLSKLRYGMRGSKGGPRPEAIQAIADACGVDFHWLFLGRGEMTPARTPPPLKKRDEPVRPSRIVSRS